MSLFLAIDNIINATIGALLIVSNVTVLAVVAFYANLRQKYSILAIVLFNSSLTGVFSISNILFAHSLTEMGIMKDTTTNRRCLINPLVMLDVYLAQMNGISLLAISVERLLVLLFPLQYYVNWKTFAKCQIILWMSIGISISSIFAILVLCTPQRTVSIYCRPYELLPDEQSFPIFCLPSIFGILSIGLMVIVVILVRQGVNKNHSRNISIKNARVKTFHEKQIQFTRTMLISCVFTLILFVIPTLAAVLMRFIDRRYTIMMARSARYLRNYNCFNIVIVILKCQRDVRLRLLVTLKGIFLRKGVVHVQHEES